MGDFAERGGEEAVVAGQEYLDLPLVAYEVLEVLRDDLAAPELYREYVGRYLQMWPGRCQRVVSALDAGDPEALMDAVLSIKTSAGMLGALRLVWLASDVEDAVRKWRMDRVRALLPELKLCGQRTTEQLTHQAGEGPDR